MTSIILIQVIKSIISKNKKQSKKGGKDFSALKNHFMNRKFVAKSNFVLRRVLNSEDNIDILKEFIEVILDIEIKSAKINPYLERIKNKLPSEENFGIADLRVQIVGNEELNIGIQIIDGQHILTKMFLYFAQINSYQLEYKDNREFAKTITINILDDIFTKETKYHSRMILKEEKMTNILEDYLEIHILELPKFKINKDEEMSLKGAWLSYLKGENIEKAIQKSENIKKLDDLLNCYWDNEIME